MLATMNFGFMTFDGIRALTKGDYMRPAEGVYAGQLGPWHKIVEKTGIHPESTTMKSIFVFWGICGLFITACYVAGIHWAWKGLIIFNILSLWYLIPGTASSLLQIALLFAWKKIR